MPVSGSDRTIVVMRHAKAGQVASSDADRELTGRGRDDAAAAGSWLAGEDIRPGAALVSAVTRTRQTWDAVASGAGWDLAADFDRGLYSADEDTVLDLLRRTADEVRTVVVIGHNPTMSDLAQLLEDGDGDGEATTALVSGFPTCAMAVFDYAGTWADLDRSSARLRACHVARG